MEMTGYAGATITAPPRERGREGEGERYIYINAKAFFCYVEPRIIQCHVPGGNYREEEEEGRKLYRGYFTFCISRFVIYANHRNIR